MRADSLPSKFFAAFEGTRSAYPIALFRIAFFGGLALHFFPSLIHLDENYTAGALRTEEWNHWLYTGLQRIPLSTLRVWSVLTMGACVLAILGLWPRATAIVSGVGFYVFASFNGLPTQTLALVDAWAILLVWMICGGGAEALSVEAFLEKRRARADATDDPPRAPRLLSALVLYQVLLGTFFAGIEKLLAGWPGTNEMGILLNYPRGFVVRDWVAAASWLHGSGITHAFTWLTLFVEIGTPLIFLLGRPRSRAIALAVYEAFFIGIVGMLQVPPLFYGIFAVGGLLVLDDEQVEDVVRRLRRLRRRS
ncbi:MAG TPA: hypothetical protein VHS09_00400 [Polyangiaceae bacterium]|nr:hypothetical protein [Polyangiaceae bacterium]